MRLEVKDLSFCYDKFGTSGFRNISFGVETGEVTCILGPNGCGKTTLLKCLNGLLRPKRGAVFLNGQDISRLSRPEIARSVGYVPQLHQPIFAFSVLDVVLTGRAPHLSMLESPSAKDMAVAEECLETLGIYHLRNKPYTQLSGGERQLVILARVLAQQPALLLMDEPTSHLDFGNQIKLLEIVQRLARTGLTIIMTSHFPDHVFLVSTKVALMKEGEFVRMGAPEDVITDDTLEGVYDIKVRVVEINSGVNRKVCVPLGTSDADLCIAACGLPPGGALRESTFRHAGKAITAIAGEENE